MASSLKALAREVLRGANLVPPVPLLSHAVGQEWDKETRGNPPKIIVCPTVPFPRVWDSGTKVNAPAGDDPAAWRAWYDRLVDRRVMSGHYTLAKSYRLAYGELQNEWHRRHGAKSAPDRCAGCGEPIGDAVTHALPDGAAVHGETLDCLIDYGRRWRHAAADGLAALGLPPPEGWEA